MARRAVALAEDLGHRARASVADDPLLALALATWSAEDGAAVVVPEGQGAKAVAPLPVEALLLPAEVRAALRTIGVRRIGEFARLDPASVAGRYPSVVAQHRIARGLPASLAHLIDAPTLEAPRVSAPLQGATTAQQLAFVLPDLVRRLCGELAERDLAAVRIRVVLGLESHGQLEGRPIRTEVVRVGRPTRATETLERLIRRRIEQVRVDSAIESLRLEAVETTPDTGWQPGLSDRRQATEPLPDLMARLADQLGDDALSCAELVDRWKPEAAWVPAQFPAMRRLAAPHGVEQAWASDDPVEVQEAFEQHGTLPRPSVLLGDPVRIEVECRDGRPVLASIGERILAFGGPTAPSDSREGGGILPKSSTARTGRSRLVGGVLGSTRKNLAGIYMVGSTEPVPRRIHQWWTVDLRHRPRRPTVGWIPHSPRGFREGRSTSIGGRRGARARCARCPRGPALRLIGGALPYQQLCRLPRGRRLR